jgi:hypothetical protein
VRLEGDSFADDNAFHSIVQVRNQLNVLLIDGKPGAAPLEGATDFLELALTPHTAAANTLKDLIRTKKVDLRKLRDDDFKQAEVVILANVEKLQGRAQSDLDKFVKEGGGLLIFAGPDCDIDWYNRELYRKGEGLLPAAIKGQARAELAGTPARVLMQRLTHPSVLYFNDARGGRLQDAEFRHWFEFAQPTNMKPPSASSISTATSRCCSRKSTARAASSPPPPPQMPNGPISRSSPSSCR